MLLTAVNSAPISAHLHCYIINVITVRVVCIVGELETEIPSQLANIFIHAYGPKNHDKTELGLP